jgi:hypothetical protein
MSEVNDILKKVTASIEEATGKFNAKAEDALKERRSPASCQKKQRQPLIKWLLSSTPCVKQKKR